MWSQNQSDLIRRFVSFLQRFFEPRQPQLPPPIPTEDEKMVELVDGWPEFDGSLEKIPHGRREMVQVYGDPHVTYTKKGARVSRKFARNLHTIPADRIPGYSRRIYMHRFVAPYFVEAMRRAKVVTPGYSVTRIGCFNPRHMRHDKSRPLSDHTWAIAFDVNSSTNRAFYRKPTDPRPFEEGWEKFSSMPEAFVLAWESVGFTWGGRWGNGKRGGFCDPMHYSLRS